MVIGQVKKEEFTISSKLSKLAVTKIIKTGKAQFAMREFYTQITELVTRYCGEYLPYRVRESWCNLIISVLVSGSVVLNRLSATQAFSLAKGAKLKSLQRHLKRVIKDERLNWKHLYAC
jgi:predicted metal-dependent peptidase